jgi:xylulokinase
LAKTYLLGVDIGTYSSKGTLIDAVSGQLAASIEIEHGLSMPKLGWVEHDADQVWWGEFVTISRDLLSSTGIPPEAILGIGVSGIGPCVLPVDENGHPLRPGILYGIDTRASQEIAEIEQALGKEAIVRLSGSNLDSSAIGPKILWIKHHEPDIYEQTRWFLTCQSYIVYKLTGRATVDVYTGCNYGPLIDIENIRWVDQEVAGMNPYAKLPELLWTCDVAGEVTAEAARTTGLAAGTPVIVGTIDAAAEAISAGLSCFGDMMMMIGSSNSLIVKTDRLIRTEHFWGLNWLEPNTFAVVGGMTTVGSLTRWFRDHFSQQELAQQAVGGKNAYAALADLLYESPVGARGLVALPYFQGERTPIYDPDACGVLFGLTLHHTRADMYRALLEGVGFGLRHNMDMIQEAGVAPERILGIGGGTKNLAWMQIIADIVNLSISIPLIQMGASYGDAVMAGVGTGVFKNLEGVSRLIQTGITVHPQEKNQQKYRQLYAVYRDLYLQTKQLMHTLTYLQPH